MKPLLEINSPLYIKRLVREVNKILRSGGSVYAVDEITREKFKVWDVSAGKISLITNGSRYSVVFFDHTGEEIVASREQ
jgi:hypothetical protein